MGMNPSRTVERAVDMAVATSPGAASEGEEEDEGDEYSFRNSAASFSSSISACRTGPMMHVAGKVISNVRILTPRKVSEETIICSESRYEVEGREPSRAKRVEDFPEEEVPHTIKVNPHDPSCSREPSNSFFASATILSGGSSSASS